MFRRYRVILREQGIDYNIPEDDTLMSKHIEV